MRFSSESFWILWRIKIFRVLLLDLSKHNYENSYKAWIRFLIFPLHWLHCMITSFHICGFHGYRDTIIPFTDHSCIIGGNGSGKTHILEGIHLASGGAFQYIQAPRWEDSAFEITFLESIWAKHYIRERRENKDFYQIQWSKISGKKYLENLPYRTVFLSPFDMNLFYFAPSYRRDMLDSILERTFWQFRKVRREYEEIMRQRNALLKQIRDSQAERQDLSYWNRAFAEKSVLYHMYRMKWVDFISTQSHIFENFLPKYQFEHIYTSKLVEKSIEYSVSLEESLLHYLEENTERDILTWHTHIGPHLDDFSFLVKSRWSDDSVASAYYLSRGENKVLLLTLKQIEILFLRKYLELPIILLFDDVFAELDFVYAETVIAWYDVEQVIMTSQRPLPQWENWEHFSCINLNTEYYSRNT